MKKTFMLDTNICSFIIREKPNCVLVRLQQAVEERHRIVLSTITYAELLYGANSKKASPKLKHTVQEFVSRMDDVLPWNKAAVEAAADIKKHLEALGTPIGANDTAIAGHAIAAGCMLVTHNMGEFSRVPGIHVEDWAS